MNEFVDEMDTMDSRWLHCFGYFADLLNVEFYQIHDL